MKLDQTTIKETEDVVFFVDVSGEQSETFRHIETACKFYGLELKRYCVEKGKDNLKIKGMLRSDEIGCIIITAKALNYIDTLDELDAVRSNDNFRIPILIIDLIPETSPDILKLWSNGAVTGCTYDRDIRGGGFYVVSKQKDITRELAGLTCPFDIERDKGTYYINLNKSKNIKLIIQITKKGKKALLPIFIKTTVANRNIFFMSKFQRPEQTKDIMWHYLKKSFFHIAPFLILLRDTFGDRCWHSSDYYANFFIDDPWLIEPYGYLSYQRLLDEIEKSKFHVTIGHIPWNYDRSKPKVVSLFQKHPDKLSICIHGNNHNSREFNTYEKVPLSKQEIDIQQSIARMSEFNRLTKIPYGRVMVFPHGISPEKTLSSLKKYGFIATCNVNNFPLGSNIPSDPFYLLRSYTMEYENFLSIRRFSPKRSHCDIAIELFLGNPLIFYSHHDYFKNSIDAFNKTAQKVNNLQPFVKWKGLENLVKCFYLQRLRKDGDIDVMMLSCEVIIQNKRQNDVKFYVKKEENFSPSIKRLRVDGKNENYYRKGNYLTFQVVVEPGGKRHIELEYDYNIDLESIEIARKSFNTLFFRMLSDFRDLILSGSTIGRRIHNLYYDIIRLFTNSNIK